MSDSIYLDYNATTPIAPEVLEAMLPYLREDFGNPSSSHVYGRRAREAVEEAREQVAGLIGAETAEIVFTSGGTEATNLALFGAARCQDEPGAILSSTVEHPATSEPLEELEQRGWQLHRLGLTEAGVFDLSQLPARALTLGSFLHAHNETGCIQPIRELADHVHTRGGRLHVDASQSLGKIPVDVEELGADLLTIAGHKLYAPKGIGALYQRQGVELVPHVRGGGQERGLRPGTLAVPQIVGLGAACHLIEHQLAARRRHLETLREHLEARLKSRVEGLLVVAESSHRLPNTTLACFPGVFGFELLASTEQVAGSAGSACHTPSESRPLGVLEAMGLPAALSMGAVRLSLGVQTTREQLDRAVEALVATWHKQRNLPSQDASSPDTV